VDALNAQALASLDPDREMRVYHAIDSGEAGYLETLQRYCPAKDKITLKIGAQVILVKTIDASIGLVNGAKGVVIDFTRSHVVVDSPDKLTEPQKNQL
jgi:ATP-dependent DNA helicase PIF1